MAILGPGGYNLLQNPKVCDKKSMLFVKLTDSAQRALTEFLESQDKCKQMPVIEFNEDSGRILIPTFIKGSFAPEKCMAQFRFDIDSNITMQGQKGRFECIQNERGSQKLIKVGPLTKRLKIHANEDVFQKTKNRMAAIELELRKNCTVEIDLNLATVNRKVKVERNTKLNSSNAGSDNFDSKTIKTLPAKIKKPRLKNQPKLCNSNIMKRPLRERIIHMLAVRPHRKIELSAALRKDGLRESDKTHLMVTLTSVATLKDNMYHLLRHVWNDIQEDWPFYNEVEKQLMKRNKPQNMTPPTSDSGISVSSNQSPSNTSSGDKSPSCQYKRPGYLTGVDGFQTKRHRISHYIKQNVNRISSGGNEENLNQISPSRITNCFDEVIEKSGLTSTVLKNTPLTSNFRQNTAKSITSNVHSSTQRKETQSDIVSSTDDKNGLVFDTDNPRAVPHTNVYSNLTKTNKSKAEVKKSFDNESKAQLSLDKYSNNPVNDFANTQIKIGSESNASLSPLPAILETQWPSDSPTTNFSEPPRTLKGLDYTKEYVTITDLNQRRKYKADFKTLFEEYQILSKEINQVANYFSQLAESLKQHEKGSSEFKKIEAQIFNRYQMIHKNTRYHEAKKRFHYLHDMLSHIKGRVQEYDETLK